MKKNIMVAVLAIAIVLALVVVFFALVGKNKEKDDGKLSIVTTTFSSFDFTRQITRKQSENNIFTRSWC